MLINLIEKNAESLGKEKLPSTTVQELIPESYGDISQLIEEYIKESKIKKDRKFNSILKIILFNFI